MKRTGHWGCSSTPCRCVCGWPRERGTAGTGDPCHAERSYSARACVAGAGAALQWDAGEAPLFSALLNYRHSQGPQAHAEEWTGWEGIEVLGGEERTNYPLTLSVDDLGDGFALTAQVADPVAPERVCGLMETALGGLVDALESTPDMPALGIEVLPAAEREQVLVRWNETHAEFPRDHCVHQLFEEQVERTPDAVAVVFEDRQLSYGELNAQANQLAHHLRGLGVCPGECVAIVLDRSLELVTAELAILKCGGTYVPLDPSHPIERLATLLADCGARFALCPRHLAFADEVSANRIMVDDPAITICPTENLATVMGGEAIAYVMYTSGSTGSPKGVTVPHRAIVRLALDDSHGSFGPDERIALAANPAFDVTTLEVWAPLLNGGCIVVIPHEVLLNPPVFAAALDRYRVTVLWLSVGIFNEHARVNPAAFANLRYLLVGGETLDPASIARVLRDGAPRHLLNSYGPTETCFATTYEIRRVGRR